MINNAQNSKNFKNLLRKKILIKLLEAHFIYGSKSYKINGDYDYYDHNYKKPKVNFVYFLNIS